jgi:hypothetical protein
LLFEFSRLSSGLHVVAVDVSRGSMAAKQSFGMRFSRNRIIYKEAMSYDLTVQPDDERSAASDIAAIEAFLQDHPGTCRSGEGMWIYEPQPQIHVELYVDMADADDGRRAETGRASSIGIAIPYPFLSASGEPALRLAFQLARRLGWRVLDEQSGEYIKEDDLPGHLQAQIEFGESAEQVIDAAEERWFDRWTAAATQQNRFFMIFAVALAMVAAGALMLWFDVPEEKIRKRLFWTALPIGLALFTIKILLDDWFARRRRHSTPDRRIRE